MKKHIQHAAFVLACAALALVFSSCSKSNRQTAYPVRGQVFDKNNKPAVGALIIFHPVDQSDPNPKKPLARVDKKGDFALTTYTKDDGGPVGEYIITIEWRQPPKDPSGGNKEGSDRLKGVYSNPNTSKLRFKITNQPENIVPPIHLQ